MAPLAPTVAAAPSSPPATSSDTALRARSRQTVPSHPAGTHWSRTLQPADQDAPDGVPEGPISRDDKDFYWDEAKEPHAIRRAQILRAHPEVKTLMGPCPRTKYVVAATLAFHVAMCHALSDAPWWVVFLAAYVVAGTLNHMMLLAIHEIAHNLAFRSPLANRVLGIVANLCVGVPSAASFRRYHLEHHKYQGEDVVDVDIPLHAEALLFNSLPGKVLWCLLQPFFYALRPLFVNPKPPGKWELINFLAVGAFDVFIFMQFGGRGLFYTIGGSLLGMGLHPVAGHFIAEHYVFVPGQETYSYYGPLNIVAFNVGYHNEHHDFANIPGSRLPQLRAMAPEFYNSLPSYASWSGVIFDFILNGDMCGFSRVKRTTLSEAQRKELHERECRHSA